MTTSNTSRRDCSRCGGTGTYVWGAIVNGVPSFAGQCFRCGGSGNDPRPVRDTREEVAPAVPVVFEDGLYTLLRTDGSYFTFKLRTQGPDESFAPGKTVAYYLSGSDNENSYTGFAFVSLSGTVNMYKKFQSGTLAAAGAELQVLFQSPKELEAAGLLYAERSGRCRRCNRMLTVPISLAAGYGPECRRALGISGDDYEGSAAQQREEQRAEAANERIQFGDSAPGSAAYFR